MPRANRSFLPGLIWHITHRCHQKAFLLGLGKDRENWVGWLGEARRRFRLCVLNYVVTRNHVHLVARDRGRGEIAQSMQLIAGRTAQQYNERKGRRGAFWEDRYHATAVESHEHLARCITYVDLNMVRAGAVSHPADWETGGYREIQDPPKRYRRIDIDALLETLGFSELTALQQAHREWVREAIRAGSPRDDIWSKSIAVGSAGFVQRIKDGLGPLARRRRIVADGPRFHLA